MTPSKWYFRKITQATEGKVDSSEQRKAGRAMERLYSYLGEAL